MKTSSKILFLFLFSLTILIDPLKAQELSWAKSFGDTSSDAGNAIVVDKQGNVYVAGYFTCTVDFDPGPDTFKIVGVDMSNDIFVSKFDPQGNFLWAKRIGGHRSDGANSLALDSKDNVYVTGWFGDTVDFDPGPDAFNLISHGERDVFICELDSNGNFIWAKAVGGPYEDRGTAIAIDNEDHVYTVGTFRDTVDLDPGAGYFMRISKGRKELRDFFVLKLDSKGDFIWAESIGGTRDDYASSLAIDGAGNINITGSFGDLVDFDPGAGTYNVSAGQSGNLFILVLDSSGDLTWVKSIGGAYSNFTHSIATDPDRNVYITGEFKGAMDFDPGIDTFNLTSPAYNAFILKINSSGNFVWAKRIASSSLGVGYSIYTDALANIYSTGFFTSATDFDPGPDTFKVVSPANSVNAYILKLNADGNFQSVKSIRHANSNSQGFSIVTDNSGGTYVTGTFVYSSDFDPGSDSLILTAPKFNDAFVLKLQCHSSSATISPASCNSYTAPDGQTYTQGGTYTAIIPNSTGCDSVITINLTINQSPAKTVNISACGSYIAPDGKIYTSSGTYTAIVPNLVSCDSIITINLTINKVKTDVRQNGTTLIAEADSAQYLWIDCSNNTGIENGIYQSFTPWLSGSYAVAVTKNGCTDTSACHTITIVGIKDVQMPFHYRLYPNPACNTLTVEVSKPSQMLISNAMGQVLYSSKVSGTSMHDLTGLAQGIYYVKLYSNQGAVTEKLLITSR